MSRVRRVVAMLVIVVAVVAVPTAAWASFSRTSSQSLSVSSDTLAPASNVTFTKHCSFLGFNGKYVVIDWTATPETYATGYTVTLTPTTGTTLTSTVSGRTTTETNVDLALGVTYTITVAANYRGWTSAAATAPSTVSCGYFGN